MFVVIIEEKLGNKKKQPHNKKSKGNLLCMWGHSMVSKNELLFWIAKTTFTFAPI